MRKNTIFGIMILVVAVSYLLKSLELIDNFSIFNVVLLCYSLGSLFSGIQKKSIPKTVYSLGFVYYFGAGYFEFPEIGLGTLLAFTTLTVIGFIMIFGTGPKFNGTKSRRINNMNGEIIDKYNTKSTNSGDFVNVTTAFSCTTRYISSNNFKKCDISCAFGEVKIYFDQAQMLSDSAKLDVSCAFGEVSIFVPSNWEVQSNIDTILGEECIFENNNYGGVGFVKNKVLKVDGGVFLGEIKIIYI